VGTELHTGRWSFWALDFCRAISYRPWWARLLFWLALGEPGRHEFWGLVWAIQQDGISAFEPECGWRSDLSPMPLLWLGHKVEEKQAHDGSL